MSPPTTKNDLISWMKQNRWSCLGFWFFFSTLTFLDTFRTHGKRGQSTAGFWHTIFHFSAEEEDIKHQGSQSWHISGRFQAWTRRDSFRVSRLKCSSTKPNFLREICYKNRTIKVWLTLLCVYFCLCLTKSRPYSSYWKRERCSYDASLIWQDFITDLYRVQTLVSVRHKHGH